MVATLKLRTEQLAKYRTLAGLTTDRALAERMGTSPLLLAEASTRNAWELFKW